MNHPTPPGCESPLPAAWGFHVPWRIILRAEPTGSERGVL